MLALQATYYGDFKGAGACSYQVCPPTLPLCQLAPAQPRSYVLTSVHGCYVCTGGKSTYPAAGCQCNPCGVAAQYGDAYARPWTAKLARGVAMNAPQYGGSEPCGMCIAYRGTGRGSGADPVPVDELQFALVTDLCPECAHGARPSQAR